MRRLATWHIPVAALSLLVACALLTGGSFTLTRPIPFGLTFNSMLEHLLRGEFDVDPATIKWEGFRVGDKTYSYFGILPAFFRLVLLPFGKLGTLDLTQLSIALASAVICVCVLDIFATAARRPATEGSGLSRRVAVIVIAGLVLSGPQVQLLRESIYQEIEQWAAAAAAAFVCVAFRAFAADREFSLRRLSFLAVIAGLCLAARVSTGLGLYVALGLLLAALAWRQALADARRGSSVVTGFAAAVVQPRIVVPMVILLALAACVGFVNFERWGNPLTFIDFHYYALAQTDFPDRVPRLERYGEFNLARLFYGLGYYFLPIWALRGGDGRFLFSDFQAAYVDAPELPPSSFLWSDPLLCVLVVLGIAYLATRPRQRLEAVAVAIGLAVPAFLMLIAIYMAHRYRVEFYGLFYFLGAFGLAGLARSTRPVRRPLQVLLAVLGVVSVIAAGANLAVYNASEFGPAATVVPEGSLVDYYAPRFRAMMEPKLRRLGF
jgi:hypothetical protein